MESIVSDNILNYWLWAKAHSIREINNPGLKSGVIDNQKHIGL